MATATSLHLTHAVSMLKSAFAAFTAGARTVPLGDNGAVIEELATSAGRRAECAKLRDPFRKI